jgi:hypothetical protein
MSSFVIGVAGGSGSGKTTVVRRIVDSLGSEHVTLLDHDRYYRDRNDLRLEERAALNYDHPDSLETDLLVKHVRDLKAGRAVEAPRYDFTRHARLTEKDTLQPRRALIVDYKTGQTAGFEDLKGQNPLLGGRHLQLALYARALRAGLGAGADELEVRAEFRFVTSRGGFSRLAITANRAVEAELERIVGTVAEAVGQGAFPAVPGAFSNGRFENCRNCAYDRVCAVSRDEAWERKCRQPGAELHLALAQPPAPGAEP